MSEVFNGGEDRLDPAQKVQIHGLLDPSRPLSDILGIGAPGDGAGDVRLSHRELKREFGDKLIFHGGVDNQFTLAFGTVEDVRTEVLDDLRLLGEGGGYILAPCHNIQAVSPPENIVMMYQTAYENGWVD